MIKKLAFAILAAVAIIALPSCENNGNDDKGGKDNVIVLDRQVNGYYLGKVWDFQGTLTARNSVSPTKVFIFYLILINSLGQLY